MSIYTILTQALHANSGQLVIGTPVIPAAQMAKTVAPEATPALGERLVAKVAITDSVESTAPDLVSD